ncbi:hypothetical protein ABZX30_03525 [Streptomyces sp. NPDC004542]|uniref:hypothetical protein n=1 Tax=Streptomyces sp. NPDC004542 TaxID=3154281 RepID=UPI00339DF819
MSRAAKSSTAGSGGVVLSGSRNSLTGDAAGDADDGRGDAARRFGLWDLRDMRF